MNPVLIRSFHDMFIIYNHIRSKDFIEEVSLRFITILICLPFGEEMSI